MPSGQESRHLHPASEHRDIEEARHLAGLAISLKHMYSRQISRINHRHYARSRAEYWLTVALLISLAVMAGYAFWGRNEWRKITFLGKKSQFVHIITTECRLS